MAARSTHVRLENLSGRLNLRLLDKSLDHGEWTVQPPQLIGNAGEWESESAGFATGTEGRVSYQIETVDEEIMGRVDLHWDNPFVGSNSYEESVLPRATSATDQGFSVGHVGGDGDNASVLFKLLSGFCEVNSETGETSCSTINPLMTAEERFAAVWEQSTGPSWRAVHGFDSGQYQQLFDELVPQGFRPVIVSGYTAHGADRFAALFEQREGPAFVARHGIDAAAYQQVFDEVVPQGFRPTSLSGYSSNGVDRFAAVFEQIAGPAFVARHGIDGGQYQQLFDELVPQGFRPVVVSGYFSEGVERFTAVFDQRQGPAFVARHGIDSAQYQETFDEVVAQGFRLVWVNGHSIA
jgi:hypothetical protein